MRLNGKLKPLDSFKNVTDACKPEAKQNVMNSPETLPNNISLIEDSLKFIALLILELSSGGCQKAKKEIVFFLLLSFFTPFSYASKHSEPPRCLLLKTA